MKCHAEKRGVLFQVPSAGWTEVGEHLSHNFHTSKELFRHDKNSLIFPIDAVSLIQKASSQFAFDRSDPHFSEETKKLSLRTVRKMFWVLFCAADNEASTCLIYFIPVPVVAVFACHCRWKSLQGCCNLFLSFCYGKHSPQSLPYSTPLWLISSTRACVKPVWQLCELTRIARISVSAFCVLSK